MPGGESRVYGFEEFIGLNEDCVLVSVMQPWKNTLHVSGHMENVDKCLFRTSSKWMMAAALRSFGSGLLVDESEKAAEVLKKETREAGMIKESSLLR